MVHYCFVNIQLIAEAKRRKEDAARARREAKALAAQEQEERNRVQMSVEPSVTAINSLPGDLSAEAGSGVGGDGATVDIRQRESPPEESLGMRKRRRASGAKVRDQELCAD